jgi:hypothetical protein
MTWEKSYASIGLGRASFTFILDTERLTMSGSSSKRFPLDTFNFDALKALKATLTALTT